jgi:hypothetical protein
MSESTSPIEVALRIPGTWRSPKELIEALPNGYRFTPESLVLTDGTEIAFGAMDADDQFPRIFATSCRQEPTDEEKAAVENYTVNVLLSGPGGSLDAARTMMEAGAAIVRAGGAGVFIDNSGLAHGGQQWLAMAEDGSSDALSYAFASIVGGRTEVYTMGMHVLGLRDVIMKRADADADESTLIEMIRYLAAGDKPIDDGHILADLNGPRFQAFVETSDPKLAGSPMYNPFGRLKLVSVRDIAESN